MKVIFLDFDGVLNSRRFLVRRNLAGRVDDAIDPEAVARLNQIIARTGAKVVISSTWRSTDSLDRIISILQSHGFAGEVIGTTPVLSGSRGGEIKAWLDGSRRVKAFVILDDADDLDPLRSRHVRTSDEDGLLDHHVAAACTHLARRRWWPF
jgi:hypothetical protein